MKKKNFFFKIRNCSNEISFETLFVESVEFFFNIGPSLPSRIKQTILRAHQNALQIFNQYIKTFQMSYQGPLYTLFHPDPGPASDPTKFHAPWVASIMRSYLAADMQISTFVDDGSRYWSRVNLVLLITRRSCVVWAWVSNVQPIEETQ